MVGSDGDGDMNIDLVVTEADELTPNDFDVFTVCVGELRDQVNSLGK